MAGGVLGGARDDAGVVGPDGQRPDPQTDPLGPQADGGRQRKRIERGHLARPHRPDADALRRQDDLDRLLVRAIEPEGHHDAELTPHNIAVSVG
jgi:hypothetical protein